MSSVANACGITKATLYHHFPGKEELFAACITHGYSTSLEAVRAIVDNQAMSPREKMREALHALYECAIELPVGRMSPLIAEVSSTFPNVARSFHAEHVLPQQALIAKLVDQGVAAGEFRDVNRRLCFHLILGPIVTLSLSRQMFATFEDLDALYPVGDLRNGHIETIMDWLCTGK